MVCLCSSRSPLAGRAEVSLEELREEPLVLFLPPKSSSMSIARIQGQIMGDRSPAEFYFCESAEAITVLVTAGYGISLLPDFLVPDTPLISKIPVKGIDPVSFGVCYRSVQGNPALKAFLSCARDCFS